MFFLYVCKQRLQKNERCDNVKPGRERERERDREREKERERERRNFVSYISLFNVKALPKIQVYIYISNNYVTIVHICIITNQRNKS